MARKRKARKVRSPKKSRKKVRSAVRSLFKAAVAYCKSPRNRGRLSYQGCIRKYMKGKGKKKGRKRSRVRA